MMMRTPLLGGLLAMLSSTALAADIEVKEFGHMTRVTIPTPINSRWEIAHTPEGVLVDVDAQALKLSSDGVESNARLSKLNVWSGASGSGIDIAFACDCTSSNYVGDDARIVIDIVDKSRPISVVPATMVTNSRNVPIPTVAPPEPSIETIALPSAPINLIPPPQPLFAAVDPPKPTIATRSSTPIPDRPAEVTEVMRLSQMLVATPVPRVRPAQTMNAEDTDSAIDAIRKSIKLQMNEAAAEGRITLTDQLKEGPKLAPSCPDDASLDLQRLTETTDFREPLPALRAAIFNDMKQVDPAAVRALARHFIAFGLGTEVRTIFEAFETKGAPETMLLNMASFLDADYGKLKDSALFQQTCGKNAAVWLAAYEAVKQSGSVSEAYAATDGAIFNLAEPLKMILSAQVALGLLDEGKPEIAMRIWRSLEVAQHPKTPEYRLLKAYISNAGTPSRNPLPSLLHLSETKKPEAVLAGMRAAYILIEGFDPESAAGLLKTFDDTAFVYRGSDLEPDLLLARSKLNARYGNLATALSQFRERAKAEPEREAYWQGLIQKTIRSATKGADPMDRPSDFAAILSAQAQLDVSPDSDTARLDLARKLIDAGGAHVANQILTPAFVKRSAGARTLMAEAFLLMGKSESTIALLKGQSDKDSLSLRKRAMAVSAGDMRTVMKGRFEATPSAAPDAPLTHARQLLDDSQLDLTIVEEILADG